MTPKQSDAETGRFTSAAIDSLASLADIEVEREWGPGTELSHWDEARYNRELMTGFQDTGEHVLPVTIDVMEMLGHAVQEPLHVAATMAFSRQHEVQHSDFDHFEETDLLASIPHRPPEQAG
ncbi:MAG: hypothetical protein AAGH19_03010 [Pseudomonadota bacterium]